MGIAIVTGSAGLVGSEAVRFLANKGLNVIGIDNNLRQEFFGPSASTINTRIALQKLIPSYIHIDVDIRNDAEIKNIFSKYAANIVMIVHAAAQPSHDWAANDPFMDFSINANGTMVLLEATRKYCPEASFIFLSTNKVYGNTPNFLPLVENQKRWELDKTHPFAEHGIDESMSIDHSMHSLFGVSKAAADLMVQEYGRYFGMNTVCFRGGCLTGPAHAGAELHGFLAYLMKCATENKPYTVFGYKGKQVRDNIHANDLVGVFWEFHKNPRPGEVYNIGGGRRSNCSVLEAIEICEQLSNRPMKSTYNDKSRQGDHMWWITDVRKINKHFPEWVCHHDIKSIMQDIYDVLSD